MRIAPNLFFRFPHAFEASVFKETAAPKKERLLS